jgi:hypothetical protein
VPRRIQLGGNRLQGYSSRSPLLDHWKNVSIGIIGGFAGRLASGLRSAFASGPGEVSTFRPGSPQDPATGFVRRKGSPGPLRNTPGFIFGHRCQDMYGQAVRVGVIAASEVGPAVHKRCHERDIPGQPVQLGDNQRCPAPLRMGKGLL